jgi:gluconate 2-dehydrogenase gamma chain
LVVRSTFDPSRRRLLTAGSMAGVAVALPLRAAPTAAPARYAFLNAREASFVETAVARLIPRDELGPGALEAGVPHFIDGQLAGAWGAGARLYRSGPWREGEPTQGYQLPDTPAELFRRSVREVDVERFASLPAAAQDDFLRALERQAPEFFDTLLALTKEGFFGDPMYGGNRGMAGWRLVGFPGAYANYYDLVDRHGVAFAGPPVGIESHGHSHR